jgi:urease accessory protein
VSRTLATAHTDIMAASAGQTGWCAQLALGFENRSGRTLLARNLHQGPLRVQKALYPEGSAVCHVVVLHPPGGIAGGDELSISASCGTGSRALLTTPGAAKWYRSEARTAAQRVRAHLENDSILEWLPRESILFDGSHTSMSLEVDLTGDAKFCGWEILVFGRRASGERWSQATLRLKTRLRREGRLLWSESAHLDARSGFAQSPIGLRGFSVCGTLVIAGCEIEDALLSRCRDVRPTGSVEFGITRMPSLLIARYLGHSSEQAFAWFTALWEVFRRELMGAAACRPRVWAC